MMRSDLHVEQTGDVLREGLQEASGPLYLVNPTREAIRELVTVVQSVESPPPVRLFADDVPLKRLTGDFLVASTIADLVEDELLAVRTLEDVPRSSLVVTAEFLVSLVVTDDQVAGLTATDESFVSAAHRQYEERWTRAPTFPLRTPPLSEIRETLGEEIGPDAVADFDRILGALETARGDGDGLDEVSIALLVAANNGELLYDISRWGEDIRLASKATFSRSKNRLEDAGLVDTEKVPIDVGRPRLRLKLGDERLREADIEAVTRRAVATLE